MKPQHPDTRQHILDTGSRIIAGKGFSCVGLNEILQAAEVPKGSFYHYFKSKELFGQAMLEGFFEAYLGRLDALFPTPGMSLRDGTGRVIERLADCVAAGVADESLPALDPEDTARTLYQLWLGASLLAKLHRDASPLEQAMRATLQLLSR